ncbi:hypothetical protein D3C80_1648750 [compost metagenome]
MYIPKIPVPMAGKVLKIPSGSQVLEDAHKCPFRSVSSIQAARLVPLSKLAGPNPGTGTKAIKSQYPTKSVAKTISCVFKLVFKYKIEVKKYTMAIRCKTPGILVSSKCSNPLNDKPISIKKIPTARMVFTFIVKFPKSA